jgi:hypothetical protein
LCFLSAAHLRSRSRSRRCRSCRWWPLRIGSGAKGQVGGVSVARPLVILVIFSSWSCLHPPDHVTRARNRFITRQDIAQKDHTCRITWSPRALASRTIGETRRLPAEGGSPRDRQDRAQLPQKGAETLPCPGPPQFNKPAPDPGQARDPSCCIKAQRRSQSRPRDKHLNCVRLIRTRIHKVPVQTTQ